MFYNVETIRIHEYKISINTLWYVSSFQLAYLQNRIFAHFFNCSLVTVIFYSYDGDAVDSLSL